jgi:anti-sigma B factor antagonist
MIRFEKRDKIEIVSFTISRINALIADEIRDSISKILENPNSKVIIDLTGVEYIDSSGFGCFLSLSKAARNSYSTLKFSNPEPKVIDLFETLNLNGILRVYHDIESCVASFS